MSVIVKDMEMPITCCNCKFREPFMDLAYCHLAEMDMEYEESDNCRHPDCPLVEIPTPHGRLIDKDKLRHELFVNFNGERIPFYDYDNFPTKIAYIDLHSILAEQKTVIEAEGSEE